MIFMSSYSFNDDIISVGINVYEFNNGMHFTYADDGKIFSLSNSLAKVEYNYTTDRLGSGYSITLANGRTFTRNTIHDDYRRGLVMNISSALNGSQLDYYSYAYDALNRLITRNGDRFGYNERSEVVEASISGNAAKYGYDEIGNSTNWNANSLNQYSQLQHDLDGNLLTDGNLAFTYDSYNRLKTVSSNGVLLVTNFYDAKSRRVKKVTPTATTIFFYDGWNLIEERVAGTNGTVSTFRYYWGKDVSGGLQGAGGVGGLLYLTHDDEIYIPLYDSGGNVTKYIDASGNIVASYTYGAFGQLLSKSGPLADVFRFRFSTKYYDAETGLYYYGYRFYSTALMRWLNRDPIEENGGLNLYGFCGNNGINKQDFLGMSCTLGTFNVLAISIASTPQSVKANLESLEKSSKELLEALERAGTGMSALSLATSTGFASLMLSLGDEMIAGNISPSIEDLRSAITSLFRKLRQTPLRLDGVLKWEKCECISGDTRWVRQSDIKESENVSFENIGINSAYSTDFRGAYKRLEKSLIRKLYDNLR